MTFWSFKTFYDICANLFSAAFMFNQISIKHNMIGVRIHLKVLEQPEDWVLLVTYTDAIHSHMLSHSGVSSENGYRWQPSDSKDNC